MSNNAESTLATTITVGATTISVQTGHGVRFPAVTTASGDWFPVTLEDASGNIEITRCTDVTGDVLTVTRAQEGTTAFAFAAGALVHNRLTVAALQTKADVDQVTGKALFTHPTAAPNVGSQFLVVEPATGALAGQVGKLATYNGGDHTVAGSWTFTTPTAQTNYIDPNGTVHTTNSAGIAKSGGIGDADTTHAAAAPAVGSSELVLGVATGAYAGQEGKIATYNGGDHTVAGSYTFTNPAANTQYADDAGVIYTVGANGTISSTNNGTVTSTHPTAAPAVGATFYTGANPTGAFAGQANMYATYNGGDHTLAGSWTFKAAPVGNVYKNADGTLTSTDSTGTLVPASGAAGTGATSVNVTEGALQTIATATQIHQILKLSDGVFAVAYMTGSRTEVVAITMTGDTITATGTPVALYASGGSSQRKTHMARVSDTEFLVAYTDPLVSEVPHLTHFTLSGATTLTAVAQPDPGTNTGLSDIAVVYDAANARGVVVFAITSTLIGRRFTLAGTTVSYPAGTFTVATSKTPPIRAISMFGTNNNVAVITNSNTSNISVFDMVDEVSTGTESQTLSLSSTSHSLEPNGANDEIFMMGVSTQGPYIAKTYFTDRTMDSNVQPMTIAPAGSNTNISFSETLKSCSARVGDNVYWFSANTPYRAIIVSNVAGALPASPLVFTTEHVRAKALAMEECDGSSFLVGTNDGNIIRISV